MWLKQILTDTDFGSFVLKSRAVETYLNGGNGEVDIKDSDIVIVFVTTVGKHFVKSVAYCTLEIRLPADQN